MNTLITEAKEKVIQGDYKAFFTRVKSSFPKGGERRFELVEARWYRAEQFYATGQMTQDRYFVELSQIQAALLDQLYNLLVFENAEVISSPEKLITHKVKNINWLEQGLSRSRLVCRIQYNNISGTGSVIYGRYLLTCNHVIPDHSVASSASLQFNYRTGVPASEVKEYRVKTDGLFHTNTTLDYTICEVADPHTDYLSRQEHIGIAPISLSYTSDTEHGSSGSPIYNQSWEIIGIHTRNEGSVMLNAGTRITGILNDLLQAGINL
ncbi:hypothetical protein [Paraflavitalea speifideaquila]|uniref:trypsin-like serine peptidase n=1 Tax=Paraflavitalea speifideaquila TaxID=3076558 RepID=UPI0028E3DD63|nr:hypothetical protein [Paraflavitalea speifideiaquila]